MTETSQMTALTDASPGANGSHPPQPRPPPPRRAAPQPPRPPGLSFVGGSMVFPDGTHALRETTFDVRPGEFVTVVGPSGCGTSTRLRIASGLPQRPQGQ